MNKTDNASVDAQSFLTDRGESPSVPEQSGLDPEKRRKEVQDQLQAKKANKLSQHGVAKLDNALQTISQLPSDLQNLVKSSLLKDKSLDHDLVARISVNMNKLISSFDPAEVLEPDFNEQFMNMIDHNASQKGWTSSTVNVLKDLANHFVKKAEKRALTPHRPKFSYFNK